MLDVRRRPMGRLFYWLLGVFLFWEGIAQLPAGAADAPPATTRVSDTVYRADSQPAAGTVLISWPAFTTSDAKPVAAGSKSIVLGADGSFVVDLVPNAGATPAGTYYSVVFNLDDAVRKEFWLVGTSSPTTISAVRATPGSGTAMPPVSKQYVDNAIAENKAYVDSAVASVGSGAYVSKNGDMMSGPLTLPSDPTAPNQASTKHYVDNALLGKANVVGGVVPPTQLGSGSADGTHCLKGDSTWGTCGGSGNATSLQGVDVDTAAPSDGQVPTYDQASKKYVPKASTSAIGGNPSLGVQVVGNGTTFASQVKPVVDARDYGAKGDGQVASDCYMTAGNAVLNCESGHFVSGDVGKKIAVYGSGPTLSGFIQPLSSTISSYQSATQVTLANAAGNSTTHAVATITSCSRLSNVINCNTSAAHGFQAGQMVKISGASDAFLNVTWPIITVPTSTSFTLKSYLQADNASITGGTADGHSERTLWGSDNTATLQAAVDAAGTAGGAKVILPKGHYLTKGINMPCSQVGDFTASGYYNCTVAYNNISITGDGADVTTLENWDSSVATTGTYDSSPTAGHPGIILLGRSAIGDWDTPAVNTPSGPLKNIEISGLTLRQVKNPTGGVKVIFDWVSNDVRIYHNTVIGHSYECIYEGGKSRRWDVHDNTLIDCGNGGPAVSTSTSALNQNGNESTFHHNFVSNSGQCMEGAGRDNSFEGNTCDMRGPDSASASPLDWLNLSSATYGIWRWVVRNNKVIGGNGGAGNGNGMMRDVTIENNTFIDAIGGPMGSGKETNNVAYGPQPDSPHGASSFSNNTLIYTGVQMPVTYPFSVSGGQPSILEDWLFDSNRIIYKTGFCGQGTGTHNACLSNADCTGGLQCTVPAGAFAIVAPGLGPTWKANTTYANNSVVAPSTENGYVYMNKGGSFTSNTTTEPTWCTSTNPPCTVSDNGGNWTLYGKRPRATFSNTTMVGPAGAAPYGTEVRVDVTPPAAYSISNFNYNLATRITTPAGATTYAANQPLTLSGVTANSFTSTVPTGTAPFSVASSTNVPNLNASSLNGATFAAPGPIGSSTPSTGSFTNLTVSGTCTGCGGGSSPLTTKGDLYTFGAGNSRLGAGPDGMCLVTDSTQALGLKWGACSGGSGGGHTIQSNGAGMAQRSALNFAGDTVSVGDDSANNRTTVTINVPDSISGIKTFANDANFNGNVTIAGTLNVGGPYQVVSDLPQADFSATANKSTLGFDSTGKLRVSENGGGVTEVAKVSQIPGPSAITPAMNGTGSIGAATTYALADHVHPTDTSRAPLASPAFTGTPSLPTGTTAITQAAGDNSTKLATTAYVKNETQFVFSCNVNGATSLGTYCGWTVPAGITLTQFDISSPGTLTCTTYPVFYVYDRTSLMQVGSFSVTPTSTGSYWSYTGTANPTVGHMIGVRVNTAAVGCVPVGLNAAITYQMAN